MPADIIPIRHAGRVVMPPFPAKIAFVAEAPGKTEVQRGEVLVGLSGKEHTRMCHQAGIVREECYHTNVFSYRPPNNNLDLFCGKKTDMPPGYNLAGLGAGKYVRPEFLPEIERLRSELVISQPNVVVALGNTALWALTGTTPRIGKLRGTVLSSRLIPGLKIIPTYHPAAVLRKWEFRTTVVRDLMKVVRESGYSDIRRPRRDLWINPTIEDLERFETLYLKSASLISFDVETIPSRRLLQCISLSSTPSSSLVIPFLDRTKPGWSYWSTQEEIKVWSWLRRILGSPIPKLGQNGKYDVIWMREYGVMVRNYIHDTMLQAHALYPELPKGLGFLQSIYLDEIAAKAIRPRGEFSGDSKRDE